MIRRLQKKFILLAVLSVFTVLLVLIGTINIINYRNMVADADSTLQILAEQQIGHKLDGKLCEIVPISHKTGEDEGLSNDVGIVFAPQPFIVCFTGHDTDVYRWEDLMRRGAYELYMAQMHTESDGEHRRFFDSQIVRIALLYQEVYNLLLIWYTVYKKGCV